MRQGLVFSRHYGQEIRHNENLYPGVVCSAPFGACFHGMNPRQVEAFAKVVEQGSVTLAATALGITQSAVSRLLQRLHEEIGFKTFTHRRGRLVLTEEGKAFYREVARMYVSMRDIGQAAARIRAIGTGSLRLCVMPGLQQGVIPQAIAQLVRRHPSASVFLDVCNYLEVMQAVLGGTAELGFATLPAEDPHLVSRIMSRADAICLIPAGHPLAVPGPLDVGQLQGVDYIRVPRARYTDRLEYFFGRHQVQPVVRMEARTILAAAELAVQGVGVCVVDPFSLAAVADARVVARTLSPAFEMTVGAVYRADEPLSFLSQELLRLCNAPA
ncbi:MAG TPA: LysR family transcriptional regulator [Bordetella sp.]|nr:LysR family transcriptional regulator [Bordetella sp.]